MVQEEATYNMPSDLSIIHHGIRRGTHMKSKLMVRLNEGKRFASTLGVVTSQVRIDVSNR